MAGSFASERFLHHSNYGLGPHGFSCHSYMHPNPFHFDPRYNNAPFNHMYFEGQPSSRRGSAVPPFSHLDSCFPSQHPRLRRSQTLPQEAITKQFSEDRQLFRQQSFHVAPNNAPNTSGVNNEREAKEVG